MQIDRKLTNLKIKVAMYEKMLLKDQTNHKIINYLKYLNEQIDVQETFLYCFEEVVSGYSKIVYTFNGYIWYVCDVKYIGGM